MSIQKIFQTNICNGDKSAFKEFSLKSKSSADLLKKGIEVNKKEEEASLENEDNNIDDIAEGRDDDEEDSGTAEDLDETKSRNKTFSRSSSSTFFSKKIYLQIFS